MTTALIHPAGAGDYLTCAAALAAVTGNGHTFIVADDYCHDPVSNAHFGILTRTGTIIRAQGGGNDKPVLDGSIWLPPGFVGSGWADMGSSVQRINLTSLIGAKVGTNIVRQLWIDALNSGPLITRRRRGTMYSMAVNAASVNAGSLLAGNSIWFSEIVGSDVLLYVYAPGGVNPCTYYQGIRIMCRGATAGSPIEAVNFRNQVSAGNEVHDVVSWCAHNNAWGLSGGSVNSGGLLLDGVEAYDYGNFALRVSAVNAASGVSASDVTLTGSWLFDAGINPATAPILITSPIQDIETITIKDGARNVNIMGGAILGGGHAAINAGPDSPGTDPLQRPNGITITAGTRIAFPAGQRDGRAFAFDADNLVVDGLIVTGQATRSRIAGVNATLKNSSITQAQPARNDTDESKYLIQIDSNVYYVSPSVKLFNNVFDSRGVVAAGGVVYGVMNWNVSGSEPVIAASSITMDSNLLMGDDGVPSLRITGTGTQSAVQAVSNNRTASPSGTHTEVGIWSGSKDGAGETSSTTLNARFAGGTAAGNHKTTAAQAFSGPTRPVSLPGSIALVA